MLWAWRGAWFWVANGIAALAAAGFLWSLRWYDGQEFLGLRQWRARETSVEDQERLHLSPLHRWVRHPWYFLGLLIIWTRDINAAWLLTAVFASAYLWFGSRFEERKLLVYHGEAYRRYRERVPGLIPLPWRHLDTGEAAQLARAAARRDGDGQGNTD
jgi:protein-S-isoprenylcysteine O-methyltransferase Ste14